MVHCSVLVVYPILFMGSKEPANPHHMAHSMCSLNHIIWYIVTCLPEGNPTFSLCSLSQTSTSPSASAKSLPSCWFHHLSCSLFLSLGLSCCSWLLVWMSLSKSPVEVSAQNPGYPRLILLFLASFQLWLPQTSAAIPSGVF